MPRGRPLNPAERAQAHRELHQHIEHVKANRRSPSMGRYLDMVLDAADTYGGYAHWHPFKVATFGGLHDRWKVAVDLADRRPRSGEGTDLEQASYELLSKHFRDYLAIREPGETQEAA